MLFLGRLRGEKLNIGTDIEVEVEAIEGNAARLCIRLPGARGTEHVTLGVSKTLEIADRITVGVFAVRGNLVTLGVEAPREVSVDRHEIFVRKQNERRG